jgi:hypothetical protein
LKKRGAPVTSSPEQNGKWPKRRFPFLREPPCDMNHMMPMKICRTAFADAVHSLKGFTMHHTIIPLTPSQILTSQCDTVNALVHLRSQLTQTSNVIACAQEQHKLTLVAFMAAVRSLPSMQNEEPAYVARFHKCHGHMYRSFNWLMSANEIARKLLIDLNVATAFDYPNDDLAHNLPPAQADV